MSLKTNNKATIRDVAKEASVSVATVSRVINNKGYVHEETKQIILDAIEKLQFEPSQLARSLSNHKTNLIGVIVPHISTTFYGGLIEGIEQSALNYGYKTMLCNTKDDPDVECDYVKIIGQYGVEGLIVASNFQHVEELQNLGVPIVSIDHDLAPNIPSITSNNYDGGALVARHFRETGCKNVLLLRGPSFLLTSNDRSDGFISEIEDDIDINISILDFDLLNPDTEFIYQYLENHKNIDGIFALSDTLALIAINCLKRLDRKIPDEVQVVGFDDAPIAKWMYPSISSVSQSIKYIGSTAFETLLKHINDPQARVDNVIVDVKFQERETTKKQGR